MAKVFSVVMNKGGSLKTSIVVNLGAFLSTKGYRVLLVDLDEQQNVLLSFQQEKADSDIMDWLVDDVDFKEVKVNVSSNLDVITGPYSSYEFEYEIKERVSEDPLFLLKEKLTTIKDDYDFVFLDSPPSLNFCTSLGLVASDELIIPLNPEYYASAGLIKTLKQIEDLRTSVNPDCKINRVIPSRVDKRSKHHKKTLKDCKEFLDSNGIKMSKHIIWDTKDGINSLYEESLPPALSRKTNKLKRIYSNIGFEVIRDE